MARNKATKPTDFARFSVVDGRKVERSEHTEVYIDIIKQNIGKIRLWAMNGTPMAVMARELCMTTKQFNLCRLEYPDIDLLIETAKRGTDQKVENAVLDRALGNSKQVEEYEEWNNDAQDFIITKRVTKKLPPDVQAGLNWLEKRNPAEWRKETKITQDININVNMSDEEKLKMLQRVAGSLNTDNAEEIPFASIDFYSDNKEQESEDLDDAEEEQAPKVLKITAPEKIKIESLTKDEECGF